MPKYWLIKSEPEAYSIDDMQHDKRECWDGIRNYQARNIMRDQMKLGDLAIFYHSSTKPPGAAGIVKVCSEAYPDYTAWDPEAHYYDPKTKKDAPHWMMVDMEFIEKFATYVPLSKIREEAQLQDMMLLRKGMRLSIQPITKKHFEKIKKMGS